MKVLSIISTFKSSLPTIFKEKFKEKNRKQIIIIGLSILFGIFFIYWQYSKFHITTQNAYVNANAISIASQVSGPVLKLFVKNNQAVKENDLLFEIDPKFFIAAVEEASAQVLQNRAQLNNALTNLTRVEKLVEQHFLSPKEKDNAITAVDVATANLKFSEAKLTQAQLNLEYTQVKAPATGLINNLTLRPGTSVQAQRPLFVLVNTEEYWVDANYKETELMGIRPKQSATITLDMYPDYDFTGIVDSISASSGIAFSLLPPQNATGNWVKVTQRIPVKVIITNPHPNYPLRVGATATVTIHTRKIHE